MKAKKTPKADLEHNKGIFFELGLIIALSLVLIAFEWTSTELLSSEMLMAEDQEFEEEIIPITYEKQAQPQKPPEPPKVVEFFQVVDNDIELENELILENMEIDQETEVAIIEYEPTIEAEEEEEEKQIFIAVEEMPSFQGKDATGFQEWIGKNLQYPEIALQNGIDGTVFIYFVVEPDGNVSNTRVLRGVDPALDTEVIRVIRASPKWSPGKQRGKPVRVGFTFPIKFKLVSKIIG